MKTHDNYLLELIAACLLALVFMVQTCSATYERDMNAEIYAKKEKFWLADSLYMARESEYNAQEAAYQYQLYEECLFELTSLKTAKTLTK